MTTIDLYKQLSEGKITQSKFLYEVRRDTNLPWILNTTSFKDAVSILKNKGIIREFASTKELTVDDIQDAIDKMDLDPKDHSVLSKALNHINVSDYKGKPAAQAAKEIKDATLDESLNESTTDEETTRIIDRLNPYRFNKALFIELDKLPVVNDETYSKTRTKVAKKLQKDPNAYREDQFANSKDVAKADEKLQMVPVKKDNFVDEKRGMTKIKGQVIAKSNTKSSTKENRKGKPKGVKELTYNAKKAKGITKVMPSTGVQKIMESLFSQIFKKKVELTEDFHHEYGHGQSVPLSEKDAAAFGVKTGIVKEINGGTLTLELTVLDEKGAPLEIHRQINSINAAKLKETGMEDSGLPDQEITIKDKNTGEDITFNVGEKIIDPEDKKEGKIKSFIKDKDGHIKALVNKGMFFVSIPLDVLNKPESDKDYRDKIFSKLTNLGPKGQEWLSKQDNLEEAMEKLMMMRKKKNVKKEAMDIVQGETSDGKKVTLATTKQGKGREELDQLKKQGATSATVKTVV